MGLAEGQICTRRAARRAARRRKVARSGRRIPVIRVRVRVRIRVK